MCLEDLGASLKFGGSPEKYRPRWVGAGRSLAGLGPLEAEGRAGAAELPGLGTRRRRRRSPASGVWRAEQWRPRRGTRARAGSAGLPGRAPRKECRRFLWPSGRRERACGGSWGRAGVGREGGTREPRDRDLGAAPRRALPGLPAPRSAASEDGPALPAAAAPHALPRCEPRRSRGRAAAPGRLVPGSAWGPGSTPDGHPRAPRRSASALRALTGPPRRGETSFAWVTRRRGGNGEEEGRHGGGLGAALSGRRGAGGLLSFSQRECAREASLSRRESPVARRPALKPTQAQGASGQERATASERSTLEVGGSDPGGAL